jgi:hypothetical protein
MESNLGNRNQGLSGTSSQPPADGHPFGGLPGQSPGEAAVDPDYPQWRSENEHATDAEFLEWQKNRFRADAGETSVGTEDGMDDGTSSTGTAPNGQGMGPGKSNLTESDQSTSAVAPDDKDADPSTVKPS